MSKEGGRTSSIQDPNVKESIEKKKKLSFTFSNLESSLNKFSTCHAIASPSLSGSVA